VLLIEQSSRPAVRAAEIVESIDRLQTLLTDQTTTVGDLRGALLRRVAERDLTPGEKALALQIVSRLAESVEKKVGAGFLSPDAIVSLNAVLGWSETWRRSMFVSDLTRPTARAGSSRALGLDDLSPSKFPAPLRT
jgi:hypothetical protein